MSAESDWLLNKQRVQEDIDALLGVGLPLETARRLALWNPTLEYDDFNDLKKFDPPAPLPASIPRQAASVLLVSLSENRWSPTRLDKTVLDATKSYAVFINDAPEAEIEKVDYFLDSVLHRTEQSIPWDYNGTAGGGEASKVSFPVGVHTITAEITDSLGVWELSAIFEVQ